MTDEVVRSYEIKTIYPAEGGLTICSGILGCADCDLRKLKLIQFRLQSKGSDGALSEVLSVTCTEKANNRILPEPPCRNVQSSPLFTRLS